MLLCLENAELFSTELAFAEFVAGEIAEAVAAGFFTGGPAADDDQIEFVISRHKTSENGEKAASSRPPAALRVNRTP